MSIDQIVSLVSSIATFVATIIVLLTLFEMQKQRRNSMSPDLYFSGKSIHLHGEFSSENEVDFQWSETRFENKIDISTRRSLSYEVTNIGMGSAKEIEINWEYDSEDIITKINALDIHKLYKIKHTKNKELVQLLSIQSKSIGVLIDLKEERHCSYEFILSSQVKNEAAIMYLPNSYFYLLSIYIFLQIEKDFDNAINISRDFPKLKMNIIYKDIGGSIYKKNYEVNLNFYYYSMHDDNKPFQVLTSGSIEFTPVK